MPFSLCLSAFPASGAPEFGPGPGPRGPLVRLGAGPLVRPILNAGAILPHCDKLAARCLLRVVLRRGRFLRARLG